MPFPLPTPDEILGRAEAEMEASLIRLRPDKDPDAIARAVRSPEGVIAAHLRTDSLGLYETHLHLRWWGDQYMPDTAERQALERHASVWGVYRRPATRAVGNAVFTGTAGTVVPAGMQLRTPAGAIVETLEPAAVSGSGSVTLGLRSVLGGTAGNAAGGATLAIVTALAGLDPQAATLDLDGLAGGAEEEKDESLLARFLETIREPGHGGAFFDYPNWVKNAFPASKVKTLPNWLGLGTVGVVVAMGTATVPVAPTPSELEAIAAHLETQRPVTAEVTVIPFVPKPVPFTITLEPDTQPNRAAVANALDDFFAREADIGERMPKSRISEAISAASGEYAHLLTVPAGDVVPAPQELPVRGAITWVAP